MKRRIRKFILKRFNDISGVSGTGIVAEGVEFSNGKAVISWFTAGGSIGIYDSIKQVEKIHGHEGRTKVIIED